jgi:putative transposase
MTVRPWKASSKPSKTEEVYQKDYQSHDDVVRGAVDFIERFYNATRLHSALGYLSPNEFEHSLRPKARRKSSKALAH